MNTKIKTHIISTITLGFIAATSANAATTIGLLQTTVGNVAAGPITAVDDDLLQTDFGSVVGGATTEGILRDGATGTAREGATGTGLWVDNGGALQTDYFFDLSTNTAGYDIEEIGVFSGWDSNRAQVGYTISYSLVGDASFTQLGVVASPIDQDPTVTNNGSDRSFLTRTFNDEGGTIDGLTGVDAIRFDWDFSSNNTDSVTRGAVLREIDIIGTAVVVPEPSSTALLGLGALALVLRRKK